MEVFLRGDGERGVRARRRFNQGEFVLEFEGNLLTREEYPRAEIEYNKENVPVNTLEVNSLYYYLHIIYHSSQAHGLIIDPMTMQLEDISTMQRRAPT